MSVVAKISGQSPQARVVSAAPLARLSVSNPTAHLTPILPNSVVSGSAGGGNVQAQAALLSDVTLVIRDRDPQIHEIPFSWGDATPVDLGLYTGVVVAISIVLLAGFNGEAPALEVRTANGEVLLPADTNLPAEPGRYEVNPSQRLALPTRLFLFITPGLGASAGHGIVYMEITL